MCLPLQRLIVLAWSAYVTGILLCGTLFASLVYISVVSDDVNACSGALNALHWVIITFIMHCLTMITLTYIYVLDNHVSNETEECGVWIAVADAFIDISFGMLALILTTTNDVPCSPRANIANILVIVHIVLPFIMILTYTVLIWTPCFWKQMQEEQEVTSDAVAVTASALVIASAIQEASQSRNADHVRSALERISPGIHNFFSQFSQASE